MMTRLKRQNTELPRRIETAIAAIALLQMSLQLLPADAVRRRLTVEGRLVVVGAKQVDNQPEGLRLAPRTWLNLPSAEHPRA